MSMSGVARGVALLAVVVACLVGSGAARAQTQVKGRVLVTVDTSGSMLWHFGDCSSGGGDSGNPALFCDNNIGTSFACSQNVACTAANGALARFPVTDVQNPSRLFAAKAALNNVLFAASGQLDFGLSRYAMRNAQETVSGRAFCPNGTSCCSPQVDGTTRGRCIPGWLTEYPTVPGSVNCNGNWVDGNGNSVPSGCNVTISGGCGTSSGCAGNCSATRGGQVLVMPRTSSSSALLPWVDGVEDFCSSTAAAGGAPRNPELRATGPTPLSGAVRTARADWYEKVFTASNSGNCDPGTSLDCDPQINCRPYVHVLMTDGAETCEASAIAHTDPQVAVQELTSVNPTNPVKTYVIGMSFSRDQPCASSPASATQCPRTGPTNGCNAAGVCTCTTNADCGTTCDGFGYTCGADRLCHHPALASLNAMAAAGGTSTARFANNQVEIEAAFADIVASSVKYEVCNGQDDNCNGFIDEGLGVVQECTASAQCASGACSSGRCTCATSAQCKPGFGCAAGICVPSCTVGSATCERQGVVKCGGGGSTCCVNDGLAACTPLAAGPPGVEVCNGRDDNCNGLIDENGVCQACSPVAEVCDGKDNDCNGVIDDNLTDTNKPCGLDIPVCVPGRTVCLPPAGRTFPDPGDHLECENEVGPTAERCNGLDDDCDGVVDGMTQACYTGPDGTANVGICVGGQQQCTATRGSGTAAWGLCTGEQTPRTEICNGLDDDCNGIVDDVPGINQSCCPWGNCGVGICTAGTTQCSGGVVQCIGGKGPDLEICDGLDNDCNGQVDDVPGVGQACQTAGDCAGSRQCDVAAKALVCRVNTGALELCDGLDNDCDGLTDDPAGLARSDTRIGVTCGNTQNLPAPCTSGTTACENGRVVCGGSVSASPEVCDGKDNDCNGAADNGATCPAGYDCHIGGCYEPCAQGASGPRCAGGYVCDSTSHCVPETCQCASCQACKDGRCVDACDDMTCPAKTRCSCGACVDDTCITKGCRDGQRCDAATGRCLTNPCANVTCAGTQYCDNGQCVGTCENVVCYGGKRCDRGVCVDDRCKSGCTDGRVCDPVSGDCKDNPCATVTCPAGQACVSGVCGSDRCAGIVCPGATKCFVNPFDGQPRCESPGARTSGVKASNDEAEESGCGCKVTGGRTAGAPASALAGLGLLGVFAARRRRRAATVVGAAVSVAVASCGSSGGVAGSGDDTPGVIIYPSDSGGIAVSTDGAVRSTGWEDVYSGPLEASTEPVCDPSVDLQTDATNCGKCGFKCGFPHAKAQCSAGRCSVGPCQPGFHNLDGDPANGCEYVCFTSNGGVELCDGIDNDCDGELDNGFNTQTDANNCGACGRTCVFNGAGASCAGGQCALGACQPGRKDLDLRPANGCEYTCPLFPIAGETCNGRDDNCDGVIDESPTDVGTPCDESCPAPAACRATNSCAYTLSTCTGRCCGVCARGTYACASGQRICQPAVAGGPRIETCNGQDDNCDGQVDEGYNLQTDVKNCGRCGNDCTQQTPPLVNAVVKCETGVCKVAQCKPGFANNDATAPGCEYTCPVNPPRVESCNGLDDDCDGTPDDNLTVPTNNCIQTSICAGTAPTCRGASGWRCNYDRDPRIELDVDGNLAVTESRCDDVDGNCNSQADESFSNKGQVCSAGVGACRRSTVFTCAPGGASTTCLAAPDPTAAVDETCNGIDDNCDGQIDERAPVPGTTCSNGGSHACLGWADRTVLVGGVHVYAHEASRPDATATAIGRDATRACSKAGALPWTSVTWTQAKAACEAIPTPGGGRMRLCSATEWTAACVAGSGASPIWSFATNPTDYGANTATCNGADRGLNLPWATGAGASCTASHTGNLIYDLSGNVAEWTSTDVVVNGRTYYRVRGGSYLSVAGGMSCTFLFGVSEPTYQFQDLGFRCCADAPP